MKSLIFFIVLISLASGRAENLRKKRQKTLQLVNVIFRHGDRTPTESRYPNDPYLNYTYPPYGTGQLTDAGRAHSFILGQQIRARYDKFVGDRYSPEEFSLTSSSRERCQDTLRQVIAALFPKDVKRNTEILYDVYPAKTDDLLLIEDYCPSLYYLPGYNPVPSNEQFYEYIGNKSGVAVELLSLGYISFIYDTILTESQMGISVPTWAENYFPGAMLAETLKYWRAMAKYKTPLVVGELTKRMNRVNLAKVLNSKSSTPAKMYLYSCHDTNIYIFLGLMKYRLLDGVQYNAQFYLELHKINKEFFVEVYFKNGIYATVEQLRLPECDYTCPLDKFIELTQWVYSPAPVCETYPGLPALS